MDNINISLTDFVDFSIRNGTSRLTKVKEIKNRPDYHPSFDYWKGVRDGIELYHKNNLDKTFLDEIVDKAHTSRRDNYRNIIGSYKAFLGRKDIEWFNPKKETWGYEDVQIRINPELGLIINKVPHIIKLYFKEDFTKNDTILNKRKIETILHLLEDTLSINYSEKEVKYSVYNAKTGRLITKNKSVSGIKEVLQSDILAFRHLWGI